MGLSVKEFNQVARHELTDGIINRISIREIKSLRAKFVQMSSADRDTVLATLGKELGKKGRGLMSTLAEWDFRLDNTTRPKG